MNCQDIEETLDNRDTASLDAAAHRGVLAHIEGCAGCARDWELHSRFASLPDAMPSAGFAARCRTMVASGSAARSASRSGRRYVLIGTIVAFSAAAAMLVAYQWRSAPPADSGVADSVTQVEGSASPASAAVAVDPPPTPAVAKPSSGVSASPPAAVSRFSVQVMPLQNDARDAAGQAAVESFYGAMLEQLRAAEGLRLVMADAADARVGEDAEFQLSISGGGPDASNKFTGSVRARRRGPDGFVQPATGWFEADCVESAAAPPTCFDASALAMSLVDLLRTTMFPADSALHQSLLTRLQDAALDPQQRLKALQDLAAPRAVRTGQAQMAMKPGDLRDPAVVRAAIELAETTTEPAIRAEVWRRMRGVSDAQLLRPLIASGQLDPAQRVRVEAVRTLGEDFAREADALAALEVIARQDPAPLVRAMAQKGLKGEDAWNGYVVQSLEDASRSDEERLEALLYHVSWPSSAAGANPRGQLKPVIDQGAIPALAGILSRVAESGANRNAITILISHLGSVHHQAITDFLIDRIDASSDGWEKQMVMAQLVQRNREDRVRAALSKVASEDPDPQLRQMAENALRETSAGTGPTTAAP